MIRKLRRKFVLILMCLVLLILLAVFASILISFTSGNRRAGENILRQSLYPPASSPGFKPPSGAGERGSAAGSLPGGRVPVLLAAVGSGGEIDFVINQLHFIEESELENAVREALDTGGAKGIVRSYGLRWLRSEDGGRIAFVDISMEQEMLKNLIVNSLLIGMASLTAFYLISLILARWAVRPIELAWERQRQFVADASHELKTPLTVILSNTEMLGGNGNLADKKNIRRIEHIRAEAVLMKKLVEDLLTLARSDSAERLKIGERVDLSFAVKSAVLTFEPIVFDERKALDCDIRDGVFVTGDARLLNQLMGILLDNAVKYCPPAGEIRVRLVEPDRKTVLLSVSNDGEPIPKDELAQIFERFYRADKARSAHGSFGLGLSIARSIVAEHSGKIWAESAEATGNSFYVSLPQSPRTHQQFD